MTCEMTAVSLCEGHDGFRYLQTTSRSHRLMAQVREAECFKCVRGETKERGDELQTQTQVQVQETTGTPESSRKVERDEKSKKKQPHCVYHLSREIQETPQSTCKQEKVSCDSN